MNLMVIIHLLKILSVNLTKKSGFCQSIGYNFQSVRIRQIVVLLLPLSGDFGFRFRLTW
jgi:hypothetical protein